jgi:hypothetical protein
MTKEKGQKDKQHNTKKKMTEGQATQWSKEKDIVLLVLLSLFVWPLCCLSFCPFLLAIVLLVLLSFSFGHYVACPSVLFPKRKGTEGQATQWSKENDRTGNTMTKRK